MKPGDHPDFFRLPPPPGRSRESTIVLDAEGRFWHDGALVRHPGMARAFASWIARHPDDDRYILTNGYDWTYLRVEDTPHFVTRIDFAAAPPMLELLDGTREPLVPESIEVRPDGALTVAVKEGKFRARLTRDALLGLEPRLNSAPDGAVYLELDGRRWPLRVPRPEA
ncbi:MAG TPA: hypothetical protein VKY73_03505 [Polyangiaceae bacterium]|nr:hypothetical protein [Polyangiaceae bacterium]